LNSNDDELRSTKYIMMLNLTYYNFYLDLDGVMADFDSVVKSKYPDYVSKTGMWMPEDKFFPLMKENPDCFKHLPLTQDAMELWEFLKPYDVKILTAYPKMFPYVAEHKKEWVAKNICPKVEVITTMGQYKQVYSNPMSILIDDSGRNIGQWVARGGIGVMHYCATETIAYLKELEKNSGASENIDLGRL
jgi:hypothetical protein